MTRYATRHNQEQIDQLYRISTAPARSMPAKRKRKQAHEQLRRHGFNSRRRCKLLQHAKDCLVSVNRYGTELYHGLIRYERMHVYSIGFCTYALELLAQLVPTNASFKVTKTVTECHQFRDPRTGASHPRLPSILSMTHLTAERRVRAIFYWAHVMGTHADVIMYEPCRVHAQTVIATLQLLLISTRGHRSFTSQELETIFTDVGMQFFRSMEYIEAYLETHRNNRQQRMHDKDPSKHPAPVPFCKTLRSVTV